ncbi:MAG: DUF6090 family protein [Gammaproteobacteria bacterium]
MDNKTGKYLKYAVGEIVLVVIGILIALQINNWNLAQQDRKIEKANLLALQEEFLQNKLSLEEVSLLNKQNIIWAEKVIQGFNSEVKSTMTGKQIAIVVGNALGQEINFSPETGALTEIVSSGQLKLVLDSDLKHKLAGFNSKIDEIEQQEQEVYTYRMMAIEDVIQYGNMEKAYVDMGRREEYLETSFKITNRALSNSLPFLNKIVVYQGSSVITGEELYKPLEEEFELILELIANRLEQLNE